MKQVIVLLLLILTLAACKQDAKTADAAAAQGNSGATKLQLICEESGITGNVPRNAIFAVVAERKTKIKDIEATCLTVDAASYASYGIPADAMTVAGSWFAGIGEFFYAKQEGDKIEIYYSVITEDGPPMGIHTYHKIATYENDKISVHQLE